MGGLDDASVGGLDDPSDLTGCLTLRLIHKFLRRTESCKSCLLDKNMAEFPDYSVDCF